MNKIPIDKIKPSTTNPRRDLGDLTELAWSIKQRELNGKRGLIQAIILKERDDHFEVVIGMRRLEAAKIAGKKFLGENEFLVEEYDEEDAIIAGYIENSKRKDLLWTENALVYKKLRGKVIERRGAMIKHEKTNSEIAEELQEKRYRVEHILRALPVVERLAQASRLDYSLVRRIAERNETEWEYLVKRCLEKEMTQKELTSIISHAKKIESRINILEAENPKLAKEIKEIWYPLRYEPTVYKWMQEEIDIRTGNPQMIIYYKDITKCSEEEAKEFAEWKMGEVLPEPVTKTWFQVYGVKHNLEEIRQKWKEMKEETS